MMTSQIIRVLYIDDDPDDAAFIEVLLQHSGLFQFKLQHVLTHEAAVEQLQSETYDVCLTDYHLGAYTAIEVIQTIQQMALALPIIVLTGLGEPRIEQRVMAAGASDYLEKTEVGRGVLQRAIRYAIERTHNLQELRNTQDELEAAQRFNEQILLSMPDIIYVYDLENQRNVFSNRHISDFLGYTVEEIQALGSTMLQDLMHPDDFVDYVANRGRFDSAQDDEIIELEYRIRHKDGMWRWLYSRDVIFERNKQGQPRLILGVAADITVRKEAERMIADFILEEERGRLLQSFIRNTMHDLRTPLSIINSSAYLLAKTQDPKKKAHHHTQISQQVKQLTQRLADMTFLTELESREAINTQPINFNQALQQVITSLSSLAEQREQTLTLSAPDSPYFVAGDAHLLKRALYNIVENALVHTPNGSQITVTLSAEADQLALRVTDDGPGIADEHLRHLFDRFYKINEARTSDGSGSGLGLPISKRIVELHGGSISAQSSPNKGVSVVLQFPYQDVEQPSLLSMT